MLSCCCVLLCCFFFFKQKTAYEMRISDWSSDVCSSDLWSTTLVAYCEASMHAMIFMSLSSMRGQRVVGAGLVVDAEAVDHSRARLVEPDNLEIGRASCRERVCQYV